MNFLNTISNKYILNICFLTVIAILVLELLLGISLIHVNGKTDSTQKQIQNVETGLSQAQEKFENRIKTLENSQIADLKNQLGSLDSRLTELNSQMVGKLKETIELQDRQIKTLENELKKLKSAIPSLNPSP
ncbi:MAG: hypothetical protein LBE18_09180 [Planctomycetaceae bacterium]|jgi:predicted  nucleic acid-binding Zn-ribbon protein|nr:hypothetical protein [Planctomycetaceae bacterium]